MTQQLINVGTTAGDGTGDRGQVPGQKVNANDTELYSNAVFLGTDTGAANAYVIATYAPAPAVGVALVAGMMLRFTPTNSNTGASTINFAGTGNRAAVNGLGNPFTGGELVVGTPAVFIYTGTNWLSLAVNTASLFALINPVTAQETAAGLTAAQLNLNYPAGNILRYGCKTSLADNTAALGLANSVGIALTVPAGTFAFTTNPVVSSPLIFTGGIFQPSSGTTITCNGAVTAPLAQIFDCSLGGTITGKLPSFALFPEHFGATGNTRRGISGTVAAALGTTFTDANAAFVAADVGKNLIIVPPAFSALPTYIGTIAGYTSATAVTLSAAPAWASQASFTATCLGTTLTVTAVTGTLYAGQVITGAAANTAILYQSSGTTGGAGNYVVSISQTIASPTAMTSTAPLAYYYGTDDTAPIQAANAAVGQIAKSAGTNVSYTLNGSPNQLSFNGSSIYLMSATGVIAGANAGSAKQWCGVGGLPQIVFALTANTSPCLTFGVGGSPAFGAIENLFVDACFTGQDLLVHSGYQNPRMRNVWLQNSARDCLSLIPAAGSYIQQADFRNVYLGPAGRCCLYVKPGPAAGPLAAGFVNELDFVNLVMQYPSVRQTLGNFIYFDTTTGGVDSWNITNWKGSTGWNGDPNYLPLGAGLYVASANGIFAEVGLTLSNGYFEQGNTAYPIGATSAPIVVAAGSYATIRRRGFYTSFYGFGVTHADHDAASQFTVAASTSQSLMAMQAFNAYSGEFQLSITGTISAVVHTTNLRFAVVGGGPASAGAVGNVVLLGATVDGGSAPSVSGGTITSTGTLAWTITTPIASNIFSVSFNNTSAVALTVSYSAITKDCGSAPQYVY